MSIRGLGAALGRIAALLVPCRVRTRLQAGTVSQEDQRSVALQGDTVAQAWSSAPRIPCFSMPHETPATSCDPKSLLHHAIRNPCYIMRSETPATSCDPKSLLHHAIRNPCYTLCGSPHGAPRGGAGNSRCTAPCLRNGVPLQGDAPFLHCTPNQPASLAHSYENRFSARWLIFRKIGACMEIRLYQFC